MNTYIISYDLKKGNEDDYDRLYQHIKNYGTWAQISESTYAIVSSDKASTIRDSINRVVPKGSTIFVVKSGGAAAWDNVKCTNEWLKNNL